MVEYHPKEESLPTKIAEYVANDQQHDYFYESFSKQRIGKLNNFTEPLTDDFIPLPIRALPTTPAINSHERDIVTSSDSGVGPLQVFSSILPFTLEHLPQQSQETANESPSTSAATKTLTPIQHFLQNSQSAQP